MNDTSAYDALSTRHRAFVDAYIVRGFNATEAYRATYGCKATSAASNGHKLLRNAEMQAAVKERLGADGMDGNEVLFRLSQIARNIGMWHLRADGTFDMETLTEQGGAYVIKSIRLDSAGRIELQFHDAQKALITLARIHGLFAPKKVEIEAGSFGAPFSSEYLAESLAKVKERASRLREEHLAERAAGRLSPERMAEDAKRRREEDEADAAAARLRTGK